MATGACIQKSGAKYSRYLALGQYIDGHWKGSTAERLGIAGNVSDAKSFDALTSLRNPSTGEQLKPKHKQKITMWDLTMAAPKSVSIMALFDTEIVHSHRQAAALLPEIEQSLVPSRNMIWTQVDHFESRAGDPHLHTHTPIINLTFNPESGKWECLRPNFMNYWAQYQLKESYRELIGADLIRLGYTIVDKPKMGFEIEGVSQELIHRLSQRSQQINELGASLKHRERSYHSRPPKHSVHRTHDEYIEAQKERLTPSERQSLKRVADKAVGQRRGISIKEQWSICRKIDNEIVRNAHREYMRKLAQNGVKKPVIEVGEGSDGGPSQARWSYGYSV